jgi:hypothetical protein
VRFIYLLLIIPLLSCFGCGAGDWGTVSGTVLLDGKPLPKGVIMFHATEDGPGAQGQIKDGAFSVQTGLKAGLKTGSYVVTVADTTIPEMGTSDTAKLLTPEKYANPKTSGLTADVLGGENTFKFEMKSSPP